MSDTVARTAEEQSDTPERRCTCVSCGECGGTGNVWFTFNGKKYLGRQRCDDLDEMESCECCDGTGLSEKCDLCYDSDEDFHDGL